MTAEQGSVPVIAIDGPSGSGKGTIARRVADALGWHLLDSGALYRLVALAASRRGIALDNAERLAELATNLNVRFGSDAAGEEPQQGPPAGGEQDGGELQKDFGYFHMSYRSTSRFERR